MNTHENWLHYSEQSSIFQISYTFVTLIIHQTNKHLNTELTLFYEYSFFRSQLEIFLKQMHIYFDKTIIIFAKNSAIHLKIPSNFMFMCVI